MVPLAAYARAVATGALDPQERIAVTDWERWYLPGTDGGAHDAARTRLPGDTVTLDQMVSAMIRESDNAAPDYLRDRLGDQALIEARRPAVGPATRRPRSSAMRSACSIRPSPIRGPLRGVMPPTPAIAPRSSRRHCQPLDTQLAWADSTPTGSARQLTALHRAIATGSFGAGADIARAQLEWQAPPEEFEAMGS